jgi:hypothetical protein
MRRVSIIAFSMMVAIVAAVVYSCDNTPTVPVPPPEVLLVSAPVGGYSQVLIDPGEAEQGDIVLVFNENSGFGVMERIESQDGSLAVDVEAEAQDRLVIQIKHDNELSIEEAHTVPPMDTDDAVDSGIDAGADGGQ